MLIRELAYDTEDDELDLLIDSIAPEPAEVIPAGDDIFLRRSVQTGRIVGATIANYSLWRPRRLPVRGLNSELTEVYAHIVRYLEVMKQKKPALT